MPLTIEVNGESLISRRAERAVVTIRVSSEGTSQTLVSDEVTETSKRLQKLFADLATPSASSNAGQAVTWWSMGSFSSHSYKSQSSDKNAGVRIYQANTHLEAKFQDFVKLGKIAVELSQMKHVNISGIAWKLTDVTRSSLMSESRQSAVRDAMAKAKDYAKAAQQGHVTPVEITENATGHHYAAYGSARAIVRDGGLGGDGGEMLSFHPEDVDIRSHVLVKFATSP